MKRFFSLLVATILLISPLSTSANTDDLFSDSADTTYETPINYLQEKGVIQGYSNGNFEPERGITRAEFIKILLANYKFEPGDDTRFTYPYEDVPEDAWLAPYIQRAWEIGLINNESTLNPHEIITRVEGSKLVLNLMGIPIPRLLHEDEWFLTYRDVRYDMWYSPIVLYGTSYGLIDSYDPEDPDYFRPLKPLTRGAATELLYNTDIFLYGTQIMSNYAELESDVFGQELTYEIPHLDIFVDVWNRLHENYYYGDEIDDEMLIYEALTGLIEGLEDPHSQFFDPPEAEEYQNVLEGELTGIGIQIDETEEGLFIQAFIINSPAEASGLMANDKIVAVDGVDVTGMTFNEAAPLIQGEVGTEVVITVEREGENEALSFIIVRAIIDIGYVSAELMDDAIYVDINLFDSLSFIDFTQAITPLIEENPEFKGFIIDVRNNPGGYLEAVKSIMGHFVPSGHALLYVNYGPNQGAMHMSTGDGEWADYPIVVLTNEGSASAAEILAMVLKEKNDAVLVGQTTYGKGTVQEIVYYNDGSSLKLTIAEWRSSKFHSINGIGLSPHYFVELTAEDVENDLDPQLETALKVLDQEIEERAAAVEEELTEDL